MNLFDRMNHEFGNLLNEALRPLGFQIIRNGLLERLKFCEITGSAGAFRLPEVFVETGTYLGNTSSGASHFFREVHTIELDEKLYEKARVRFQNVKNVTCHQGNSPDVLRALAPSIKEPALFYLDAHWSGGVTAHGDVEAPLLEEIEVICSRGYEDIILVDDLRLIGKAGKTGLHLSREYPLTSFDWRDVTMDRIKAKLGGRPRLREGADKLLIDTGSASRDVIQPWSA